MISPVLPQWDLWPYTWVTGYTGEGDIPRDIKDTGFRVCSDIEPQRSEGSSLSPC